MLFDGDELAGMSSFLGIDEGRGVLEIGGTYYRPHLRGTGFNRRVKDMMLRRAFDCGFRRVEFRVDERNKRSQAAMTKLGATREGVMRADRITWTGHVRDTVLFSILKDEWGMEQRDEQPAVEARDLADPARSSPSCFMKFRTAWSPTCWAIRPPSIAGG